MNSRDLSFSETSALNGGVQLVLNTLTSPGMVAASLSLFEVGGQFMEISKRDIWTPSSSNRH